MYFNRLSTKFKLKNIGKRALATLFVSGVAVSVIFQNCGKAGFDTTSTGLDSLSEESSRLSSGAPFAFDAAIDQISYLSCASSKLGGNSFTFRFGAYSITRPQSPNTPDKIMSGLAVKRTFFDYARANLQPTYDPKNPKGNEVTYDQMKKFLSTSAGNSGQQLQFSMRKINDLKQIYTIVGSVSSTDAVPVLGDLSDDHWLEPIASKAYADSTGSDFVNYFPLAIDASARKIEGELDFNKAGTDAQIQTLAETYRDEFASNAQLVLGFSKTSDLTNLTTPDATSARKAFGTGYRPMFKQGVTPFTNVLNGKDYEIGESVVSTYIQYPENVMTSISEVSLESGKSTGRTWTCDVKRRYTIARSQDSALCPPDGYNKSSVSDKINQKAAYDSFDKLLKDANYRYELELVRRHFPAKDWDVSIDRRCLVPKIKNFSCYADEILATAQGGTSYGLVPVEYDQTKSCYSFTKGATDYGGVAPTPYCAEIASICVRN